LLRPFLHDDVPITGAVSLHSQAYLAPSREGLKFLQRLNMDGIFDMPANRLTNQATEQRLSDFSRRAKNLKSAKLDAASADRNSREQSNVFSSINGEAKIRNGIVSTERLTFQIPGASVDLGGTFNLHNRTVHMLGILHMQSDISHVTTGFKSLLLKPLIPFSKSDHFGAAIPIAVTGSPQHYKVTQNLLHQK
jgi:AsmA-like C-terminal region